MADDTQAKHTEPLWGVFLHGDQYASISGKDDNGRNCWLLDCSISSQHDLDVLHRCVDAVNALHAAELTPKQLIEISQKMKLKEFADKLLHFVHKIIYAKAKSYETKIFEKGV